MKLSKSVGTTLILSVLFYIILFSLSFVDTGKIDAIVIFIALTPFIIWLIASGKLKEIKGPGGIGLSLKDQVEKNVTPEEEARAIEVKPEVVLTKGTPPILSDIEPDQAPSTLSFVIGQKNYYVNQAIEYFLDRLSAFGTLKYILFNDGQGVFKGLMRADDFSGFVRNGTVVSKIEDGTILDDPRVITHAITTKESYRDALNAMDRYQVAYLPVVNAQGRFIGIVNQDEIVRKILTNVLREA